MLGQEPVKKDEDIRIAQGMRELSKYHLTAYSEKSLEGYLRYLLNRETDGYQSRTQSFWLAYDGSNKEEKALFDHFDEDFLRVVRTIVPQMQDRKILEKDFLQNPSNAVKGDNLQNKILYIYGCKDEVLSEEDRQMWAEGIDVLDSHPEMTRFIVTTLSLKEKRFRGYDDIYYRKFRQEIESPAVYTEEYIYNRVLSDYQASGFDADAEFKTEIKKYIEAVLPTADLSREAFIRDIIERIWAKYQQLPGALKKLNAQCIPYYKKEVLKTPRESEILTIDTFDWEKESEANLHSKTLKENANILILALSTINPQGMSVSEYQYAGKNYLYKDKIEGYYQLDPIPRFLEGHFQKKADGSHLDEVIMLGTKETLESSEISLSGPAINLGNKWILLRRENDTPCTAADYFVHSLQNDELMKESSPAFTAIKVDEDSVLKASETLLRYILRHKNPNVYIDIHGGFRDTQQVVNGLIYMLRNNNEEIDPNKVLTVNYASGQNKISPIKEVGDVVEIFDLASGMNEFMQYGRCDSLERFFKGKETDGPIHDLIHTLKDIASGIQMCDITQFESGLRKIPTIIENLSNQIHADEPTRAQQYIKLIISEIKRGFKETDPEKEDIDRYNLLDGWNTGNTRDIEKLPDEIKWCLSKGFYQQVLALVESRMPEYLHHRKLLEYDDSFVALVRSKDEYNRPKVKNENYVISTMTRNCVDPKKRLQILSAGNLQVKKPGWEYDRANPSLNYVVTCDPENNLFREKILAYHWALKELRNKSMHVDELPERFEGKEQKIRNCVKNYLDIVNTASSKKENKTVIRIERV